jgi:hypothetical protein
MDASTNQIISIAGILVAALVALAIAHMQRKQIRQVELYRQNPEVGLKPPLHPITRFVVNYGLVAICPVLSLIYEFSLSRPVTRLDVLNIATNVSVLVTWSLLSVVHFLVSGAMKDILKTMRSFDKPPKS